MKKELYPLGVLYVYLGTMFMFLSSLGDISRAQCFVVVGLSCVIGYAAGCYYLYLHVKEKMGE